MRTSNPANVRDDYVTALIDVEAAFRAVDVSTTVMAFAKKHVAEYSLLAAAVLWEGYVSDLFVAYLNRNQSKFANYVLPKITLDTKDDIARRATGHVEARFRAHLSVEQLRAVLDDRNYNVTFPTTNDLKAQAGKLLVAADAGGFTAISAAGAASVEAWRSIRNFLAHRSRAAKDAMQSALVVGSLPARFKLGAGTRHVHDVGSYLLAVPAHQTEKRLVLYLTEMRTMGQSLCP